MRKTLRLTLCCAAAILVAACHHTGDTPSSSTPQPDYSAVQLPPFSADSAYRYVADQLQFGFRTPGSRGHAECAAYIARQMARWCDTIVTQDFTTTLWDGSEAHGRNIIASINPTADKRILLAAHWDSRLWADHDPDASQHRLPVMGANDGASGTAMLMELARAMQALPPSVGVDFIFFDLEDQGTPEWADSYADNTWCKGAQHWANYPHRPFYHALYGVLFDMVGTASPRFTKEEVSRHYATAITDKLWRVAAAIGEGQTFVSEASPAILDDHLYINQVAGIPTVDIVQNDATGSFFPHWHTRTDDLSTIDVKTLQTVARVVLTMIYADYPPAAPKNSLS